ncbi:MAG TPA: class I SAM-dependent methyltransferase [Candidatus Eubacterium avistercoris]|uniref:Class I SAM-dependent methyltransferase n=1 Tax=Candidatus Eubacterium avistercoris TaxID=2838567 RepID=A0A9D2D0M7_9FIRM|nr:class I SAM-dependent methyltransferase [Candidatus Eubacterium avistercoris]
MSEKRENPARPEGKIGEQMLERMNKNHEPLRKFGLPLIPWRKNMRILDVGCGGGATIAEMLKLSEGSVIDGVDYSPVSVAQTMQMNSAYIGTRCHVQQADAADLPFEEGTFDLITAMETVYFWPDIKTAFSQIRRVLKQGGMFAIINEACDPEGIDWPKIDHFMYIYRPDELETLLRDCGFTQIQIHRDGPQMLCVICRK